MLLTAEEALAAGRTGHATSPETQAQRDHAEELDAESVFARLKSLKSSPDA
jgi:hypothetical protein